MARDGAPTIEYRHRDRARRAASGTGSPGVVTEDGSDMGIDVDRLERVLEDLREATAASRVTLRLDTPGEVFPVAGEALAPGIRSIRDATEIDLRAARTFQYLEERKEILIQDDCAQGDYQAPRELIQLYGVKAQMLAPVVRDDRLAGIVSVHYAPAVRSWSATDIAALEDAVVNVHALLDADVG
jgi:maleate isomerase